MWGVGARGMVPLITENAEFPEDAETVCQVSKLVADPLSVLRALRDLGDIAMVSRGTNPSRQDRHSKRIGLGYRRA